MAGVDRANDPVRRGAGLVFTRAPSNERDWQADVAALARAEFNGDTVTIHGVRHCDYRTETDYACRWESRTYTTADLQTVDLSTGKAPGIAHTIASFGFGEAGYVCFSIETRKEKGEGYSAVKGFFASTRRSTWSPTNRTSSACAPICAGRRSTSIRSRCGPPWPAPFPSTTCAN